MSDGGAVTESPSRHAPQRPDYAGACHFLAIPCGFGLWLGLLLLLPSPSSAPMRSLVGPLALIVSLGVSDIGWSLLAGAFQRRRGERGRTVSAILRHALLRIAAPITVAAIALSLTDSLLLAYGLAAVVWVAAEAAAPVARRRWLRRKA